jgi:hypothetical protein
MKKIIERTIVIDPTLCCQMALVTNQEAGVFIVIFKFSDGELVSVHKRTKFRVILFTSRARDAGIIVKVAGYWHAENECSRVNCSEALQKQVKIYPHW